MPPGRIELTPGGLPAWDDCCAGQLYLRVREVFPTGPFPSFDAVQKGVNPKCSIHMVAVSLAMGMIRCAATVDENGNSPSPAEVTADADEMLDDMATLLDVIVCEVKGVRGVMAMKLDRWVPQGPNGGCHGGEWGFMIAVDPCLCGD